MFMGDDGEIGMYNPGVIVGAVIVILCCPAYLYDRKHTEEYKLKQEKVKFQLQLQQKRLETALGQACFLYNQLLDIHQQVYLGEKITLSEYDMDYIGKDFETKQLHSQVKQNIPKRISDAFNHFFRRVKNGETPGFPKFHKRVFYKSITYPQYQQEIYPNNRLYVSKIGMIKIKKHREIEGTIKTLTIKKENDEWYVVFSCDNVPVEKVNNNFKSEVEGFLL
ncbi:hypothetical protein LCGC14_2407150 [marine sediment metagenome]|uniref:Transposase n=1 Tax=marine sediment metagenome TaxID=412755 RepID=A0A0F9E5X3_9ZZZZ